MTTEVLADRLRQQVLTAEEPVEHVVLDFEAVSFIDSQGSAELGRLVTVADDRQISVDLARVKGEVLEILQADGVVARLGASHIHPSINDAVIAARGRSEEL